MQIDRLKIHLQKALQDGVDLRSRFFDRYGETIISVAGALADCLRRNGKILIFGNGGSAADAQHMAAEMVGRFRKNRCALAAIALTTDTSILTAVANDYGYEYVFSRQLEALGRPGDIAIAISTSGRSPNVVQAITTARRRGLHVLALSGEAGMAAPADWELAIYSSDTARVQELHLTTLHLLCEMTETLLEDAASGGDLPGSRKILEWRRLAALRAGFRDRGSTVVWTNGCFDILHVGHLHSLQIAKTFGDVLVVGVNTDSSVRLLKGIDRPLVPLENRMELLAALECVDFVTSVDAATPESAIAEFQPDVHCKGAEYTPPNGKPIPELETVLSYGGRVEFIPLLPGISTTNFLQRLRAGAAE